MTFSALPLIAGGLVAVAVFWCLPERYGQTGVAALTGIVLLAVAPATAAVMLISIVLVQQAMARTQRGAWVNSVTMAVIGALVVVFLVSRDQPALFGAQLTIIGVAYSTLRHIHVLADWNVGRIAAPTLGAYLRYHLLLPVIIAGPIHRLPHFERQCERRRWSSTEFFSGAERALLGFALAVLVGEYLIGMKIRELVEAAPHRGFLLTWLGSVVDLLRIYATFAGLTDVALGLCLMMGLRLEENFNKPWLARNLVEFWTRWHMTLSFWCRDYVYTPVAIWFRSPLVGIFCAMLVLGLWHGTSWYYALWGVYQAAGIVLSHVYMKAGDPLRLTRLPEYARALLGPLAVLAWVSLARPVLTAMLGGGA
jgi:alginate O-acetyltransferase complex protein AlgI